MLSLAIALLAAPADLTPSGEWEIDRHDMGCRVTRTYAGNGEVIFGFETYVTTASTTLLIAAPRLMLADDARKKIFLSMSPMHGTPLGAVEVNYGAFTLADPALRFFKLFPSRETVRSLAAANTIGIGPSISLPVPGIAGALKSLDDCTSTMLSKPMASYAVLPVRMNRQASALASIPAMRRKFASIA